MREIKFRRPNYTINNVFSHFSFWGCIDYRGNPVFDNSCFTSPSSNNIACIPKTDEQFTGLHDKNGKEIYEGDVLCHGATVTFESGRFIGIHQDGVKHYLINTEKFEVIGNIHEVNP